MKEVLDALRHGVLPASLAAAIAFGLVVALGGRRWAGLGAALGLSAGVTAADHYRHFLKWPPEEWGWTWLPAAAGVALLADLVAGLPRVGSWAGWVGRAGAAGLAGYWLVPTEVREGVWPVAAFAAVVLAQWGLLEGAARRRAGRAVPLALAVCLLGGSLVLLHAACAVFADTALAGSAGFAALGVLGALLRRPPGAGFGAGAVLLCGLMLAGQTDTFSAVPKASFLLVALAPTALIAGSLPPARYRSSGRWRLVAYALVVAAVGAGVVLAMRAESLEGLE